PWYVRSYLNSGNPIDPFLPALFDPDYVPSHEISVRSWSQPTWHRGPWKILLFFWRFTVDLELIHGWMNALSPVFLALLPLPLWLKDARFHRPVGFFLVPLLAYLLVAFVLIPGNTRYALPMFVCGAWLVGMVAAQLALRPLWRQRLLPVVLGLPLLTMGLIMLWKVKGVLPVIVGLKTREAVLETYPGYEALRWANENLPPDSLVLTTDRRVYFLDHPYITASPGAESHHSPPWTYASAEELLEGWRERGITHLIVNVRKDWMPAGWYLYELMLRAERDGLVVQTAADAAEWSRGYLTPEEAWKYAEISKVELLPNADGRGNPAAVVRPEWIARVIGGDRLMQMQGHLEALQPLLELLHADEGIVVYKVRWDRYQAGVRPDTSKNLRYLLQGIPMPPEVIAGGNAEYEWLKPYLVPQK
ncbi:MAG TPA: hypothetical protein VEI97_08660, partial [bacterium]|nr:hypothetical protein [bacterium]